MTKQIDTNVVAGSANAPGQESALVKGKPKAKTKGKAKAKAKAKAKPKAKAAPRATTKKAKVIAMLKTAKGATYAEIAKAMEWQPHTTRAFVTHSLERKDKLHILRDDDDKRGMVLRIK